MSRFVRNLCLILVVVEALILMIPTTLMYLTGIAISILGFFQGNKGILTPAFLYIAGLLLLPGYALYSLWRLVFSYRRLSLSTIPIHIWFGLLIGVAISVLGRL